MSMISFDPTRDIFGMRNMGANMGQVNDPTPVDYSGLPLQGISPQEGLLNMHNAMGQDKYNNAPNMSRGTPQPWDWRYGGPPMRPMDNPGLYGLNTSTLASPEHEMPMPDPRSNEVMDAPYAMPEHVLKGLLEAYM